MSHVSLGWAPDQVRWSTLVGAVLFLGAGCGTRGPEHEPAATVPDVAVEGGGSAGSTRTAKVPREVQLATQTALDLAHPHPELGAALAPFLATFDELPDGSLATPPRHDPAAWHVLTARLPAAAAGRRALGGGNTAGPLLHLTPVGAAATTGTLHDGRMVYPDAFAATDVIVTASAVRFEELLLLRTAAAPTEFRWRVELGGGMADLEPQADGGFVLRDQAGTARLRLPRPFAVDARGERREADFAWDGQLLTLRLDAEGLEHPILVDPAAEIATWGSLAPSGPPSARRAHSFTYDSNRGMSLLLGGYDAASPVNYLGDFWQWNGSAWSTLTAGPSARSHHAAAFDPVRKKLVVFGGFYSSGASTWYCDVWEWDSVNQSWSNPVPQASCGGAGKPTARSQATAAYDGAGVVIFGGWDGSSRLQDTWRWNGAWTQLCTSGCTPPSLRSGPAMAYDSDRGVAVLFGGTPDGSSFHCDTWEWSRTTGTWSKRQDPVCATTSGCPTTEGSPHRRYGASLAYDSSRKRTILFGGGTGSGSGDYCADTWEWNGTIWSLLSTSGPGARRLSALSFHANATPRRTYLFGGWYFSGGTNQVYGDTWEYYTLGSGCATGADCDSTYCVDLVCCSVSACGTCQRCNGDSPNTGVCTQVVSAPDPGTCDGTQACNASGVCKNANGQTCPGGATDCAYGHCADGRCCDTDCTGTCMSCAVSGHLGTCYNLPQYTEDDNPVGACVDGAYKQSCNGSGACRRDNGEACGVDPNLCASGNCVEGVCCDTPCSATCKSCLVTSSVGTCTNLPRYSHDTVPSNLCIDGAPKMGCDGSGNCKRDNGEACPGGANDCASGNCVEGYCCNDPCTDTCKSCAISGSLGTCTNLARYAHDTVPANTCVDGTYKMSCDGSGACKRDNGEVCANGTTDCASGNCVDGVCCDTGCGAACWACNLAGSVGTCSKIAQYSQDNWPANICVGTNTCDGNGSCKYVNGQLCPSGGTDCASTYCVDGVCCSTGCGAQCKSCNVAGSVGTCTNTPKYVHDDNSSPACQAPKTCNGQGNCLSDNGQDCMNGTDCASGNCVDGKCCDTTCTETCKSCNVSGSPGTCTNIPMNGQDNWPVGTCVAPMGCDGFGVCRKENGQPCPNGPTDCASMMCVENVCCNDLCTGMCKSCLVAGSVGTCTNLPPFAHDTYPTSSCIAPSACDGSGNCKLENGGSCGSNPALCASGNCVDGRCCDTTCTTACWACNIAGSEGTCAKLSQGSTDSFPGNACVTPNACDGNGVCKLELGQACTLASQCATGFCIDTICCAEACDIPCKKCVTGGSCVNIAAGAEDQVATLPCTLPNGSCDGSGHCKRVRGQPCGSPDDCVEGFCADGVCCDGACAGKCRSCTQLGFVGTCHYYPAGPDQDSDCGTGPCKGTCDGAGACSYPDSTYVCVTESCTAGTHQATSYCDGAGGCAAVAPNDCSPYECDDTQPVPLPKCQAGCADDGDCQHAFWCDGTHCVGDLVLKDACTRDSQCLSDHCVDGVCCDAACTGDCQYCAYAGARLGVCSPVDVGDDPKTKCQAASGGSPDCAGACDSSGQCAFPEMGKSCGLCSACDGNGRCTATPPDDSQCGTIDCSGLDTLCRIYDDLTANRCAALGTCKEPNAPATCTLYTDQSCSDGGIVQADGGHPQVDSGTEPGDKSGGCRVGGRDPAAGAPLLLAAVAWAWRRRRRS
jgi:hypothetical protein